MISVNVFNKKIILNDKNKGINFLLNEMCEYPTENWCISEYALINNVDCITAKNSLSSMTSEDLKRFVVSAMVHTIEESSLSNDSEEFTESIKNEYKQYFAKRDPRGRG